MAKKVPNSIDKYVGSRIRMQRLLLGMSQEKLAGAIGLTFQQVQKYEKGVNRVGASRLHQISAVLRVTPAFFFEGSPAMPGEKRTSAMAPLPDYIAEFLASVEGIDLVKAFVRITSRKLRRSLVDFVEQIRPESHEPDAARVLVRRRS